MSEQFALYRLQHILAYLDKQVTVARPGIDRQRIFDVTDAAVIVNARIAGIQLERQQRGDYR